MATQTSMVQEGEDEEHGASSEEVEFAMQQVRPSGTSAAPDGAAV